MDISAQRATRLGQGAALRVLADLIFVNSALIVAFALHFFYLITTRIEADSSSLFWRHAQGLVSCVWILDLTCLVLLSVSGFYSVGGHLRGRYKTLVGIQAVSIAYLLFGLASYALTDFPKIPAAVWICAWGLTAILMVLGRLWARLWGNAVHQSSAHRRVRPEDGRGRVLVIGGAGYIGSALLPKLLEKGYSVRLFDMLLYGTEPVEGILSHPGLELVQADFRHIDRVVEAMRDVDVVIHLGAIVGDPACALDEELTIEVNLMATRMIAEVAKGYGVQRFIFASTCSVYGASDELLDEGSALNPVSLYARSKIASEKVLMSLADPYFAPACLRFGTIFGLSGRTRFDLVVNLLAAKAVLDGEITVFGSDQWRPFLHVDDAAHSVLLTLEAPLAVTRNQVFNVGFDEQNYTLGQVAQLIQAQVPRARIVNHGHDSDRRNYRVDFRKIRSVLGFVPSFTLAQGIAQVVQAIQRGEVTDYRDSKYSNVKVLSEEGASRLVLGQNGWAYELIREAAPTPA